MNLSSKICQDIINGLAHLLQPQFPPILEHGQLKDGKISGTKKKKAGGTLL